MPEVAGSSSIFEVYACKCKLKYNLEVYRTKIDFKSNETTGHFAPRATRSATVERCRELQQQQLKPTKYESSVAKWIEPF